MSKGLKVLCHQKREQAVKKEKEVMSRKCSLWTESEIENLKWKMEVLTKKADMIS